MIVVVLLILIFVYFVYSRIKHESFGTVEVDTAKLIAEKISQQAKANIRGDFREYLHFLDALKNQNPSLEKLSTYYYWLEMAHENSLTYTDILKKN
jgi:hypothetical protein